VTPDAPIDPYAPPEGGGRPDCNRPLKPIPAVLDVIAVVSNPCRYRSRYALYRAFERHVQCSGARLTTVECAFGERPFEVTSADNPRHFQVRSRHEFWIKENLINYGLSCLPRDAQYIAWVDADVAWTRPDWVQETIQQLQHHRVVQMFSEAHDLGPDGNIISSFRSFAYSHVHGIPRKRPGKGKPGGDGYGYYGGYGGPSDCRIAYWHHPGFAWAARRDAVDTVGGLFDVAVVGESDFIMAKAVVGEAEDVLYPGVSPGYRRAVLAWQDQAAKLRGDIGYVSGSLAHFHHGPKSKRAYWTRCSILRDTQFDPYFDLKRDTQGLYQLVDHGDARSIRLRDAIRKYLRNRDEDSTAI
jgi:hypothetical protein